MSARVIRQSREYFWVQNEQEYRTCFNAAVAGCIAIIDPGNPVRKRAWERVLSWYGAVPASSSMSSSRLAITNAPDEGDAVAALHPDVAAPAQLCAMAL